MDSEIFHIVLSFLPDWRTECVVNHCQRLWDDKVLDKYVPLDQINMFCLMIGKTDVRGDLNATFFFRRRVFLFFLKKCHSHLTRRSQEPSQRRANQKLASKIQRKHKFTRGWLMWRRSTGPVWLTEPRGDLEGSATSLSQTHSQQNL